MRLYSYVLVRMLLYGTLTMPISRYLVRWRPCTIDIVQACLEAASLRRWLLDMMINLLCLTWVIARDIAGFDRLRCLVTCVCSGIAFLLLSLKTACRHTLAALTSLLSIRIPRSSWGLA